MISIDSARALADAGLRWRPLSGDAFRIERTGFESDVFTVSDMTIEPHEFDTGTILGFNGTTEWALDSLALEDALWLPREDQLRDLLSTSFRSLARLGEDRYRVTVDLAGSPEAFDAADPADAYADALLRLLSLTADSPA
ncbi:hypothetical protein [Cryobacterium cryoconiti]|uniref:Pilus assembly protein CpaE n=1 Tax=Cryobacterium cryoconiti TaxID=1259239 RepID=A0A4Y8JQL4_9MICO|nr:hypothetical protein [Cryobacterium cryoconiti]TFD26852.1 hypothetical protein E3T49_14860 [Cryobacterium cryoconiti]